jgi:hypothetical protein
LELSSSDFSSKVCFGGITTSSATTANMGMESSTAGKKYLVVSDISNTSQ